MMSTQLHAAVGRRLVLLASLLFLTVGCHGSGVEKAERDAPALKPVDYPTAVVRMRQVHEEILARPLAARQVHPAHHGHAHDDGHDHDHGHGHGHDHGHVHVSMDPLQEMSELVRWLPHLAADSDLKEEPWNLVNAAAQRLEAILAQSSLRTGDWRRETYLEHQTEIRQHLDLLAEIKLQFPAATALASDQSS